MLDKDFKQRRQKLLAQLDQDSLAILVSAPECHRNADSTYNYRQSSDFLYLVGLEEPEAVAIFIPGSDKGDFVLFNRKKDKLKEQWDGYIAGQDDACTVFGADTAYPITELQQRLPELMTGRQKIYYDFGQQSFDKVIIDTVTQLKQKIRTGLKFPTEIASLSSLLHDQRLIKSDYEISKIRKAVDTSVKAHKQAMRTAKPGLSEYHLSAELMYEFQKNACLFPAYSPIVGAGKNSCILHYRANNEPLNDGDLILIDAGAEYENYASDLTRTFPVNGSYSEAQRQIYEIVLAAQKAAIAEAKPGKPWISMQNAIIEVITNGLLELGLLHGSLEKLIADKAYLPFYMHNSGHWMGLDVHDAGTYKVDGEWRKLMPGMVLTIEPGIYIAANTSNVDEKWWNIGIRIEDDILITNDGCEVLSADLPKEIDDIEGLMRG